MILDFSVWWPGTQYVGECHCVLSPSHILKFQDRSEETRRHCPLHLGGVIVLARCLECIQKAGTKLMIVCSAVCFVCFYLMFV